MSDNSLIEVTNRIKSSPSGFEQELLAKLETISSYNKEINAVVRTYVPYQPEVFESIASSIAKKKQGLPLFGLSFLAKDNFCVQGAPLSCGIEPPLRNACESHATLVQSLIDKGATLLGSTQMEPLALGYFGENSSFGKVLNPRHKECVPGGSSSGSAAGVAAGFASFALGTDSGGSVRIPAACCGVTGFKPSGNFLAREGIELVNSMDCPGIITSTPNDLLFLLSSLGLIEKEKKTAASNFLLLCAEDRAGQAPEVEKLLEDYLTQSKASGNILKLDVSLKFEKAVELRKILIARDFFIYCKDKELNVPISYREARALYTMGQGVSEQEYAEAADQVVELKQGVCKTIGNDSIVITPSIPRRPPAWKYIRQEKESSSNRLGLNHYLVLANLCGLPALSFPLAAPEGNWPLSVQAIGPEGSDSLLVHSTCRQLWISLTE